MCYYCTVLAGAGAGVGAREAQYNDKPTVQVDVGKSGTPDLVRRAGAASRRVPETLSRSISFQGLISK